MLSNDESFHHTIRVVTASIIILLLALLWAILILIFKCLGPTKVGFLSGRLIEPPTKRSGEFLSVDLGSDETTMDEGTLLHRNEHDPTAPLVLSNITMEEDIQRKTMHKKFLTRVRLVRATFLLSGMGVVAAGALYYGKAVKSFNKSFDEVRVGTHVSCCSRVIWLDFYSSRKSTDNFLFICL